MTSLMVVAYAGLHVVQVSLPAVSATAAIFVWVFRTDIAAWVRLRVTGVR